MKYQLLLSALCAGVLLFNPLPADSQDNDSQALREELRTLKQRMLELEQRLEAAEAKPEPPAQPPVAKSKPAYDTSKPGEGRIGAAFKALNPEIGVVLQGTYAAYDLDPEGAQIPGVLLGPETELRPEGFSLRESEINISANIDDTFRGWFTGAIENEGGEEDVFVVEEAYIDTLALPFGFSARFGRWFSEIGYFNRQHSHAWDFVDAPLPYRAFLARQLNDDGLQIRWLAPTDIFLEFGTELLRGSDFPGSNEGSDIGTILGFAHLGGDIGDSFSYRFGLSRLEIDAEGRETGEEDSDEVFIFDGDSDLNVIDFVLKWAPNGNPTRQNFTLQAEYLDREEDGVLTFDDGAGTTVVTPYDGDQDGFYIQGVWQFIPRWRAGLRYDRLSADNRVASNPGGEFDLLAMDGEEPDRWSLMVDYSRSEFSRLRLQYNRDESRPGGEADDQIFLQYIMSIGAHPAHQF